MSNSPKQEYVPGAAFQLITLLSGDQAFVDSCDFARIATLTWSRTSRYAQSTNKGRRVFMHHMILGEIDFNKFEVHHRNDDGLDNRRENLQILTFSQHKAVAGPRANNTSGYKGVVERKISNGQSRWVAQITVGPLNKYLGYFDTAQEAAMVYDLAAYNAFGDLAYLNFPNLIKK